MNLKRFLLSLFVFYFLTLLETSFLLHFSFFGFIPDFILILVILWNLFENSNKFFSWGVFNALIGGFFLDVFSSRFFGFHIILFLVLAILIKKIIGNYVRIPIGKRV